MRKKEKQEVRRIRQNAPKNTISGVGVHGLTESATPMRNPISHGSAKRLTGPFGERTLAESTYETFAFCSCDRFGMLGFQRVGGF